MSYDDYGDPGPTDMRGSSRRPQQGRGGGQRRSGGDRSFDLGSYVEVKDRIRQFYLKYPEGRIQSEVIAGLSHIQSIETVEVTKTKPDGSSKTQAESIAVGYVAVKAYAYRTPDDPLPATGMSAMLMPGTTEYTRGSELENAETSAWGRALANLDILNDHGIASRDEVQKARADQEVDEDEAAAAAFAAAQAQPDMTAQAAAVFGDAAVTSTGGDVRGREGAAEPAEAPTPPPTPEGITADEFLERVRGNTKHYGAPIHSTVINPVRIAMFPESRSYRDLSAAQLFQLWGGIMEALEAAKAESES